MFRNPIIFLLATVIACVQCHHYRLGSCPRVDSASGFKADDILGKWYVIEQFDTSSSCLYFDYKKVSETELKVTKRRQFDILVNAGLGHTNEYTGTLVFPPDKDQARMKVKWPANFLGQSDYIIVKIDPRKYALVFDCQPTTSLMHRYNVAIISRNNTMDPLDVTMLKNTMAKYLDDNDYDKIKQTGCLDPKDSTINLNFDENTLKNIFNTAVSEAKNLGTQIADVSKNLVSESRKQLGFDEDNTRVVRPRPDSLFEQDAEIIA